MSPDQVLIAFSGAITALVGAWAGERIRKFREEKRGDADVAIRRYTHTEDILDRQEREIERLGNRVELLAGRLEESTHRNFEYDQLVREIREDVQELLRIANEHMGTHPDYMRVLEQLQRRVSSPRFGAAG